MAPTTTMIRPIQGYRAILSVWVVCCHVATLSSFLFYKSANQEIYHTWLKAGWPVLAIGLGFQVDVFFVISGFLLSLSIMQSSSITLSDLPRALSSFVIKRLLRLWPVMVFVVMMTYIITDNNSSNWAVVSQYFFFPVGKSDLPLGFGVVWSNRVDIEACLVLIIVLYLIISCRELHFASLFSVAALSIYPKLSRYLENPGLFGYLSVPISARRVPAFMHTQAQLYLQQRFHLSENAVIEAPAAASAQIFHHEYLVTHQRWAPFFIGLVLAYSYYRVLRIKKPVVLCALQQWMHRVYLVVSLCLINLPVFLAMLVYLRSRSDNPDTALAPSFAIDLFYSVFGRSLFALSAAYLLFRCLVPTSHPLHLSALSRFLSCDTFQFLGNMSYGVYMIHMKICYEVLWGLLPPLVMDQYFGSYNLLLRFIVHVGVVYAVSLFFAYIAHEMLEKPAINITSRLLRLLCLDSASNHIVVKKKD